MSKVVRTGKDGSAKVNPGDYILLCRPNRQWNIHRVESVLHRSVITGPGSDIPGNGLGPESFVLLNDNTYVCPVRPRNDRQFLQRITTSRGYGARSEDETVIIEDFIQGVIRGESRVDGVIFAMQNAQECYEEAARSAHESFMFTMGLVRGS